MVKWKLMALSSLLIACFIFSYTISPLLFELVIYFHLHIPINFMAFLKILDTIYSVIFKEWKKQ